MIVLAPFLIVGGMIQIHFQAGLTGATNELTKEADLLCGDSIVNYKTVQSFANEDMIIAKYEEYLAPVNAVTYTTNIKIGFGFGLSQFTQFGCFAAMFYAAGVLMENDKTLVMDNVMVALFSIMFSAF
jgi:ABC-type transport system involved in Fe-S cluster assembly fused permease/ATPase subunit